MAKSIGKYKGRTIYEGEDIDKIIREEDSRESKPKGQVAGSYFDGNFVPDRNDLVTVRSGAYGEKAADAQVKKDKSDLSLPTLSQKDSAALAKKYNLTGISDNEFLGLTNGQAEERAQARQRELKGQTSALTSYAFNPESISGFSNKFDDMRLKIDENNNDPWVNKNEKKDKNKAIVSSYTDQFASLFQTPEQFNQAAGDPNFQKSLKEYEMLGGRVSDITSKISKTAVASPYQNEVVNGEVVQDGPQTLDQYLGNISSPAEQKALDTLIPEKMVYQDQIALEQRIPEQYKALYFGTEDQIGLVQQRRQQAEEEIKILDRQAKFDEKNLKAQANFAIERNNKELEMEEATIEENRLAAKNYMTGMLAKLGALNTTGAAPQAIIAVEQKYQKQAAQTRMSYKLANDQTRLSLNEKVGQVAIDRDGEILELKGNLSKSEEEILKDIFKLQNDADKKTLDIIEKYTSEFRTQKEKYVKEAKSDAEKYASEFGAIVGAGAIEGGISIKKSKAGKSTGASVTNPDGTTSSVASALEASKGADGYVNSATYNDLFQKFIDAGGTRSEFLSLFPPNQYVNPKDDSLPSFLKFGSSSRAEASDDDVTADDI